MSAPRSSAPAWSAFERRGLVDKGSYFMGACPAHEDDKRSMTVTVGDTGAMLIKCFAGCRVEDIVEAVGVQMRELWPPSERPRAPGPAAVKVVARYDYIDEQGVLLYQVERTDPKGFRQRKPEGEGWSYKLGNVRRVLYRLPELLTAKGRPVLLVEGEKDVENLRKLGLIATTIAGGAGAWRPEYAEPLRDRTVVIIPDNDEPGRQFAMQAATWILRSLVVVLPGLAEKGDVSDWIAAGGTARQLGELARAAARAKVRNAEEVAAALGRAA